MRNFYDREIIGDPPIYDGSKFDNIDLLIDSYYALLFFALEDGIAYSTERNGIIAKVKVEARGFINYVQPCIGKWDYKNPKYQRNVSPDFVLYLFNNICMEESFYRINQLSLKKFSVTNESDLEDFNDNNEIDLDNFTVNNIIKKHQEYQEEYFKLQNGQPNYYNKIEKEWLKFINLSYVLIEKVFKYSKEFADHQLVAAKAHELRQNVENGVIDYNQLDELEQKLVDIDINYGDDYYEEYSLRLGCFNNCIRSHAIAELYKLQEKSTVTDNIVYDDPVFVISHDSEGTDLEVIIDYTGAKEFEKSNEISKKKF